MQASFSDGDSRHLKASEVDGIIRCLSGVQAEAAVGPGAGGCQEGAYDAFQISDSRSDAHSPDSFRRVLRAGPNRSMSRQIKYTRPPGNSAPAQDEPGV